MNEAEQLKTRVAELEKELASTRESEKLHRLILASVRDAVVLTDEQGNITFVCPNTSFIFGYSDEEIRRFGHISKLIGDTVVSFPVGDENQNIELKLESKDGRLRWVYVGIKPVNIFENKVLFTFHEITEIKRLQMDLRQAEKLEAVGTMSAKVAHDFNNLLAIIMGSSDLALAELSDPLSLENTINDIKAAAVNGRKIVDQMMSFAKKTVTARESVRIDKIAADHVRILRSTVPGTTEIKLNVPDDLPPVFANSTNITQILVNLCQNALQAMKNEGVLAISLSSCDVRGDVESKRYGVAPGRYVKLTVEDTGCGMTPEVKDKIFDPYFTTKSPEGGTGLGLAIINGIVKDHNGAISVKSDPGQGSVFDVYIPQGS